MSKEEKRKKGRHNVLKSFLNINFKSKSVKVVVLLSNSSTLQSLTGKYRGLQGNPCNETRDPAMRTGVPCNENRFYLVGIDSK